MDILISIAAKIAEYTVAPVGHQLGYLCFYNKNVDELKTQAQGLKDAAGRLQRRVDDAKRDGEVIEVDVQNLLTTVRVSIDVNEEFKRVEEQANTKCCTGAFPIPNLVLRHRLSRRAKKMARDLVGQIKDVDALRENRISYLPAPTTSVENRGYEEFETRQERLREIMEAIEDPNVGVIGVWGMGGVGKTMLAKEVARKAKLFSQVVFITVSQTPESPTPGTPEILEIIRKSLGMGAHEDILERIKNRLKEENNVLVIVDDVWKKIELADVGISFGSDKKGCKILVTSRSREVLNDMHVDKLVEVRILLEEEATSLFHKIVGNQAGEPDFQQLATQIIEECGGLPIAITTVASALKRQSRPEIWNNALLELRKAHPVNIKDMKQKVYNSIKLSYEFLQSGEAKKLLLLCGLFEEDARIPVELLCHYGVGLQMFRDATKLEEARDKTVTLVQTLNDHSLLLLDSEEEVDDFVKLHDVIRDVVISIASDANEPMFNVRDTDELEDKFKQSFAISLFDIEAVGDQSLQGPKLKLLRLICPSAQNLIHCHFFEGLTELLVLDLERASLKPLIPASSFCPLQNLQTLRLRECTLTDITWIGELHNLKILDLSGSSISELPKEIGKLHRLLSLDLGCCSFLTVIQPTVISSLTRLEKLNLEDSFTNWEDGDDGRPNANIREVKDLPNLTNLNLRVPNEDILPQNMFRKKLEKFNIIIGRRQASFLYFPIEKRSPRTLKLQLRPNSRLDEHDFKVLLKRSHCLDLEGLKSAKSVAYELDDMGFQYLKQLTVKNTTKIRCIVGSNNINGAVPFPSLESLNLEGLVNLENIFHDQKLITTDHQASSFGKLRKISVVNCNKMKSLFSLHNIFLYRQLERIVVWNCEVVEEIFIHMEREGDPPKIIEFSELRHLELEKLPNLAQLVKDGHSMDDDSVVPLFSGKIGFPKVESLYLSSPNLGKIWKNGRLPSTPEHGFRSLTSLEVRWCFQLKGLIPLSVAISLVHLKILVVEWCLAMVDVVMFAEESTEDAAKTSGNISIFPKLETLRLWYLPKLERFCAWEIFGRPEFIMTNSIPAAENDNIDENLLDPVDKQLLFNQKIGFPKLESLDLHSLNVEKIWKNGRLLSKSEHGFQNLTSLRVCCCGQLKGLIPSLVAISLVHLKILVVECCWDMVEVVMFAEKSTEDAAKTSGNISIFPKLETLQLWYLPKLERFCAWEIFGRPEFIMTNSIPKAENGNVDENLLDPVDKQLLFNQKIGFPKLESLDLHSLNVEKIWKNGRLPSKSEHGFQSLTSLRVCWCGQLKGLIPSSVAISLVHLKSLWVEDCKAMVEVVMFTKESTQAAAKTSRNISIFPKLETLRLLGLSNLGRFCAESGDIDENLLDPLDKQPLFNHEEGFITKGGQPTRSTETSSSEITCHAVERHDMVPFQLKRLRQAPPSMAFQNMTDLVVRSCSGSVSRLFYPSTVKSLPQLRKLGVSGCEGLRRVIANSDDDRDDGGADDIDFPQLRALILDDLKVLEAFYWGNTTTSVLKFPRLKCLVVNGCPGMKTFSHGNIECSLLDKILNRHEIGESEIDEIPEADDEADDGREIDRILEAHDERDIDEILSYQQGWQNCWGGDINTTIQKLFNHTIDSSSIRPSSSTDSERKGLSKDYSLDKYMLKEGCITS